MLRFLFDTDHLTLYDHRHTKLRQRHVTQSPFAVGLSPITVQEYLKGRLAALTRHQQGPLQVEAYARLIESVLLFHQFSIVPFDAACEGRFQQLRRLRLRVGAQDLRIAAVALASNLTLLTRNRRDFARVPGLVLDDWSV